MLKATTIVARNSASILRSLASINAPLSSKNILYCISSNADDLSGLVSKCQSLSSQTAGCLSSPLPSSPDHVSCSILELPSTSTPFLSDIAGRPQAQVGRYHGKYAAQHEARARVSEQEMERAMADGTAWKNFGSGSGELRVPGGLDPTRQYGALIFLSDRHPEGFIDSMDFYFRDTTKIGLVGSSTPFVTGRPTTLLQNASVLSEGAVGFAVDTELGPTKRGFGTLDTLSDVLEVTSSQSNLIHTLNNRNPSRLLVDAISALSPRDLEDNTTNPKDDDYYLGVVSKETGELEKIYTITSGDPKRGSLALDGEDGPPKGSRVKFLRQPFFPEKSSQMVTPRRPSLKFITSPPILLQTTMMTEIDETTILENSFTASSENGFIVGESKSSWHSTVPGSWISASFPV